MGGFLKGDFWFLTEIDFALHKVRAKELRSLS